MNQKLVAPQSVDLSVFQKLPKPEERNSVAIPAGTQRIRLRVELQTMSALMDVLITISRVGSDIESVVAVNQQVELVVVSPKRIVLRLPRLLDQIITVLSVTDETAEV